MEQVTNDRPDRPIHVYTSITANYLPKARVLATSLKRAHPEAMFHLILSDRYPADLDPRAEPFDNIISVEELPIPKLRSWIFKHTVVELCTAVKAIAAQEIFRRFQPNILFYLDPDIAVLGSLAALSAELQKAALSLLSFGDAEARAECVRDNEICAYNGIYNLGFIGMGVIRGMRFLVGGLSSCRFCYDEIHNGLFTDQRWIDLPPYSREPAWSAILSNVATWNLSNRQATGLPPHAV